MPNQDRPEQRFYAKLITESSLRNDRRTDMAISYRFLELFKNIYFMGREPSPFLLNTIIIPYASVQTTTFKAMFSSLYLFLRSEKLLGVEIFEEIISDD